MIKPKFMVLFAGTCVWLALFTAQAQTRILPLGDSDTSSFAPYSSYRYWLWHSLVNAGYNVDFVGTQSGVSGGTPDKTDYDQNHDGHPGWTTQDGLANIESIAAATQPDIVLLDLGANDVDQQVPLQNSIDNLQAIIAHLRAVNPSVIILLAQPTPSLGQNNKKMSKLRSAIRSIANHQPRVTAVNLYGGFNVRKDTFDGVHPDESGEKKIAKRYFSSLKKILR